ncbi:MAG: ATP-binding protein [Acidobacteriota bacterium]
MTTYSEPDAAAAEPLKLDFGLTAHHEPVEIELRFASCLHMTALVGPLVNRLSSLAGCDQASAYEVELCTIEAVTNSIEHGCELSDGYQIRIGFRMEPRRLEIRVCDTAPPIGLEGSPEEGEAAPEDVPDLDGFRGRGLFIMTQLMESVRFESSEVGKWHNTVIMERSLTAASEESSA